MFSSWIRVRVLVFNLEALECRLGQLKDVSSRLEELEAWSTMLGVHPGLDL